MSQFNFRGSIVFLVASGVMLMLAATTNGDRCSDGLGLCGTDCPQRCQQAHPGGSSDCSTFPGQCTCHYDCPPSPHVQTTCNGSAGVCGSVCGDDCCTGMCQNSWPASEATGHCQQVAPSVQLCLCTYEC